MPHIFRFHTGRNNNIYDWKSSDRITAQDVRDVADRTNLVSSGVGTSIPTPVARMYLYKTAFEITAAQIRDNKLNTANIYSGLVSETLDLLELLFVSGMDTDKFRFSKWTFHNTPGDDKEAQTFFGQQHGHRLLAESFRQAASQAPFHNKIEITLIYYREGRNEVLAGGTSPFTFLFLSPNFIRKLRDRGFKPMAGLISGDTLFDNDYKQLYERDEAFIKYVENLVSQTSGIGAFEGFLEYVANCRSRYPHKFQGALPQLQEIHADNAPVMIYGVPFMQRSQVAYQADIHTQSDFRMELPPDTSYTGSLTPLFLIDRMPYEGQYTSPSSKWAPATRISENAYPETRLEEINMRELPGTQGLHYPFFSPFDFFEKYLLKLDGYTLNDERFVCLDSNQQFALPIKPLFFNLFPVEKIKDYLAVEVKEGQVIFNLSVPVFGPTKNRRVFTAKKIYAAEDMIAYEGILGIFPFTKATEKELLHTNKYTVAVYEKTNAPLALDTVSFFKRSGINALTAAAVPRATYPDINTRSTYYQLEESFDLVQLGFKVNGISSGGVIIPKFKEIKKGTEAYVYAIDFGTSNTHVEYGRMVNDSLSETRPFEIDEKGMQVFLLNKPRAVVMHDGADGYHDYERSMGMKIETARKLVLREFVPFQIGERPGATVKFPFRTATCESNSFQSGHNNSLFTDANIGFHIDEDAMTDHVRYKTDLKWLLERGGTDPLNQQRISLFFRELLLMIRTKVLLEDEALRGDLSKLKIAMSFPISMGDTMRNRLRDLFKAQHDEIFGAQKQPLTEVTESVAPYYQLKYEQTNIQNDSYCNIDIGGGTCDVVLIDKNPQNANELICHSASFRFAGRQLWSSGANEFNAGDNGFLLFYKQFISKKSPDIYSKLERLFSARTMRTEDITGLLFSKPEYRFTEIFQENKELKAPLLIHYAAILYYIAQLAAETEVPLPRTISFSGKGSEYLSLIFPDDRDLKGFTQKLLGIFAGKPTRGDFAVQRSASPKAITARGAAHYASEGVVQDSDDWGNGMAAGLTNEKKIRPVAVHYKGYKDKEIEQRVHTYSDILNDAAHFAGLLERQQEFLELLFDNEELVDVINRKLELRDFAAYKQFFIPDGSNIYEEGRLRDSLKATLANTNLADKISDIPFFFPLNYSLTAFAKDIAQQTSTKL